MVLLMPFGVRVFARPMRYCSLARRTLSRLSLSFSNAVTVRSLMVCSGLWVLMVCPMYWQFLCPLVKQRLHCKA